MQNIFRILENIYQSQRTEVYSAIRESDSLPVILKVRNGPFSAKPEAGLAHEYELGKTLESKRSVKYLELKHSTQQTMLVLQDNKMNSLESQIPKKGFDLPLFLKLAIKLTRAIKEIHAQGVIHKNINPANIIVNSALGAIKLIDFGLATRISEEMVGFEPPSVLQGTVSYISPEQTGRINKPVDSRTDLYSLGATLYQLITGKPPFNTTNPGDLIYSHIAKIPVPAVKIRQDIPQAVSLVIEKLLKKSPDKRYQTATGIIRDLLYLQKNIPGRRKIVDFSPGQNEQTSRMFSGKLYGREKEATWLLDCFSRCHDAGHVVTVTGPAGIGKTALIRELYTPITIQKGFFLAGKFDQLKTGLAYTALTDALKDFVRQCRGQDEETMEVWRTAIRSSVGEFGQVLTDIIPEFKNLIGKQPGIAPVSPLETVAGRNSVFSNLVKDICAKGLPLVIFLDDLQWADSATLSLLETIIEINPQNLLIILSYRDNEILPTHPVKLFLNSITNMNIALKNLHLESLSREAVNDWMNDVFPDTGQAAKELAAHTMSKTEGNPFYITSLLHLITEKNCIKRQKDGTLSLDMDAVSNIPADADVIEHLIKKIKSLEPRYREFLTQISILGNRFSVDTIDMFWGEKQGGYQEAIQAIVSVHLLIKSGEIIMFAHDRVQQAARSLLNDQKANDLHLKAGQNIRAALETQGAADEHIEEYIHHYNAAADLITDVHKRLELAKLNTVLGKRFKSNAAYQAAKNSFAQAAAFLPINPFEIDYNMAIDLFTEYGEALFLNLKYEEGEKQFDTVITHSKSPLDSARVYVRQIKHHVAQHNIEKSMKIALHSLKQLGINLPKRMLKIAVIADLLKIKTLLKNKKPEDILNFPVTEDPLVLAQMEMLSAAAVSAYLGYPDYYPIIVLKMMRISIIEGNCKISPYAYVNYAVILCKLGDTDAGYAYGRASLELMERLNASEIYTKVSFTFGMFVHHWKAPLQDSIEFFDTAIAGGMESGDYEFASHAANLIMHTSFYFGRSIDKLSSQYPAQHKILNSFGKDRSIFDAKYWHQLLITMNDPTGDGITVSGDKIDETWLIPHLEKQQDLTPLAVCIGSKVQLAYMAGDYETAESVRPRSIELLKALPGLLFIPVCHFFAALTCIAYYRKHKKDASLLRDAKRSLKKLKKWGADAPENYLYKAQLVEAELLSVKGKQAPALKLYEAAIDNARKAGNSLDHGIACECMGRYLESIGLKSLGLMQIRRSIAVFHDWGALNKSNRLIKEYDIKISRDSILPELPGSTEFDYSSQAINTKLNLEALSGTIKLLTSDLKFNSLLETLLDAVKQSSGATQVVYIHMYQGKLQVRAERHTGSKVRIFEAKDTPLASHDLPVSLLEKFHSGSCEHVLENIKIKRKFWINEQKESRFKSILIIPLIRRQSIKGLVYLENDLMKDAFREDHVQFLSLLAGQAAIALENALVFEKLNLERDYSSNIIQNAPTLICGIDGNGITTFINPVVEEITGYCKDELIGKNWWELFFPGEEYAQVDRLFTALSEGEIVDYEMHLTCKNGDRKDVIWNSITKRDSSSITEVIGFGNDITERKRTADEKIKLQKQLQQAHKMEAIGTLAGGIAHDFNNILGIILGNTELAMYDVPEWDQTRKSLEEVKNASLRAKDVIQQLLSFSRKSDQKRKPVKVSSIIKDSLKFLRSSIPASIEIHKSIPDESGIISADPTQIHQVMMNLCTNAAHAMSENGGIMEVSLSTIKIGKDEGTQHIDLNQGRYVMITVSDTGYGIAKENLDRIFDPYFTTKKVGEGSGIGLSIIRGIVKNYEGDITVDSEPGKGTTFHIYLPVIETLAVEDEIPTYETLPRGEERILMVDDEEEIALIEKQMLERLGYQVTALTSSIEALEIFRSQPESYDLVITDMTMPEMTGDLLAVKLIEIRKNIPIILCTGFSEKICEDSSKTMGIREYIMKPVAIKELAKTIRKVLTTKSVERRKQRRFNVKDSAIAIPKSDPKKQGQIIDISRGGLAYIYNESDDLSKEFAELAIIMADKNFNLDNIPCKTISDVTLPDGAPLGFMPMKRRSIQFGELTANQTDRLDHLIENHTIEGGVRSG